MYRNLVPGKEYTIIDLFCGCGGFSLGFKMVSPRFKVVGAIDKSDTAIAMYKSNFFGIAESVICDDITKLDADDFQEQAGIEKAVDIIIGGPPCPGFSNIGRSKIMNLIKTGKWKDSKEIEHIFVDDPRNKLFHRFVHYVKNFQPKIFVFENVSGISSAKIKIEGKVFDVLGIIKSEFESVGYTVMKKKLSAADYGVPQIRERYFLVGIRKDLSNNFKFPEPTHSKPLFIGELEELRTSNKKYFRFQSLDIFLDSETSTLEYVSTEQALIDLPPEVTYIHTAKSTNKYKYTISAAIKAYMEKYGKNNKHKFVTETKLTSMENYLRLMRNDYSEILKHRYEEDSTSSHVAREPNPWAIDIFPMMVNDPNEYKIYKHLPDDLKRYGIKNFQDKVRRLPWWRPSYTILAHLKSDGYMFIHPDREVNRVISVREAARLQSFPDQYNFRTEYKIPYTKQYWHIGNAVPPLLARALGKSVLQWLDLLD